MKKDSLLIRSPALMSGYLDDPQRTAAAMHQDAYNTGDIGRVDADGFVYLTGRLARFAKIGGEMVPLDRVQEALQGAVTSIHSDNPDEAPQLAVAAIPCRRRGEKIIVLHIGIAHDQHAAITAAAELPPIFTPKTSDWYHVDTLPVLGTGKLDLKGLTDLALHVTTPNRPPLSIMNSSDK